MVVHKGPDVPRIGQMTLNLERPALERGLAFPEKFAVMVNASAVAIVFRGVIAEKAKIKEVGRVRKEFERREIALVQSAGVGPNPANPVFFQEPDDLRTVPAGMAKLDGKPEAVRKLLQEFPQGLAAILGREGGGQLNEDDPELRLERLDGAKKGCQFPGAIAQPPDMGDFPGQLAGKTKSSRRVFHPAPDVGFGRRAVKSGIDLHRGKIVRIELQPAGRGQIGGIKATSPFLEAPRTGAEPDFLLCREIQWTFARIIAFHPLGSRLGGVA